MPVLRESDLQNGVERRKEKMTAAVETIDAGGFAQQCWIFGPVAERHLQANPVGRLRWWHGIQIKAAHYREDEPKVRTILVSSALFLTVALSVGLGIASAYAAIHGILQVFAQHPRSQEEPLSSLIAQEEPVQH